MESIVMAITGKTLLTENSGYLQTIRDSKVAKGRSAGGRAVDKGGDTVRLSKDAREAREAIEHMRQVPDIRSDKVAELKAKVNQAAYRVDGRIIAFKLLKQSFLDGIN